MPIHQHDDLREFARQHDGSYLITGDMLIGDVIAGFPKAAGIMLSHGLHCVGCHANVFDTIEGGARGHGMDDAEIALIIDEINTAINRRIDTIDITPGAVAKILELRAIEHGKEDWPLRITVRSDAAGPEHTSSAFQYEMDFGSATNDDMRFDFNGLIVVVDPASYALLQGSSIDYIETFDAAGFKIDNPRSDNHQL